MPLPAAAVAVVVAVVGVGAAETAAAAEVVHVEGRLGALTVASGLACMLAEFAGAEAVGVAHSMAVADSGRPVNCR